MSTFRTYIRTRLPAAIAVILLAVIITILSSQFGSDGPLHRQLSKTTGLTVTPDSVEWLHPFEGAGLKTATRFQDIVFLAKKPKQKYRDLYLARVRLAPEQKIIAVSTPVNLTSSDAGDDYTFQVHQDQIVVATRVLGQVRSLTVFHLDGAEIPKDASWSTLQRTLAKTTDYRKTGRWRGISKTTIRFNLPARKADFAIAEKNGRLTLKLKWSDSTQAEHVANVDMQHMKTSSPDIQVLQEVRLPKKTILWVVDSVRELEWIGPGPIEWAEGRFFAIKDRLKQIRYSISGDVASDTPEAFVSTSKKVAIALPEGTEVGDYEQVAWPPKTLEPPVFSRRKQGEGEWIPSEPDFMRTLPNAPPSVYKTYIRSDQRRPYTHVKLYAIDTRQLALHMVGGHEDPISTTGEVGTGQLPRDRETVENLALVFNGAFKTIHGQYGMMADRTVLLPPKDDAATVATDAAGRVALGSWPKDAPIPDNMISFRQNMDPLLENGVINPRKRYLWGFTLGSDITQMNTIRSGLCIRDDGILVYAWGDDLTADTLGIAMRAAECSYGIHLDMNPFHTALVAFQMKYRGEDTVPKFEYKRLIRDIRFWPDRYVHGAPKDFFYMTLRATAPPGENWQADHITQPAPAFLPSLFKKVDGKTSLLAVNTSAVKPSLLPGSVPGKNDGADSSAAATLPEDLGMVAEILMGKWSSTRGQMTNGTVVASLNPDEATMYINADGELQIGPWLPGQTKTVNALQGEWLIRNGEVQSCAGIILAVATEGQWIYLAKGKSADVTQTLSRMKIENALKFDASGIDILVRSDGRMTDMKGAARNSRDVSHAALRFSAAPRAAFGTRLKELFATTSLR